jgi:hypothetical protein
MSANANRLFLALCQGNQRIGFEFGRLLLQQDQRAFFIRRYPASRTPVGRKGIQRNNQPTVKAGLRAT